MYIKRKYADISTALPYLGVMLTLSVDNIYLGISIMMIPKQITPSKTYAIPLIKANYDIVLFSLLLSGKQRVA